MARQGCMERLQGLGWDGVGLRGTGEKTVGSHSALTEERINQSFLDERNKVRIVFLGKAGGDFMAVDCQADGVLGVIFADVPIIQILSFSWRIGHLLSLSGFSVWVVKAWAALAWVALWGQVRITLA